MPSLPRNADHALRLRKAQLRSPPRRSSGGDVALGGARYTLLMSDFDLTQLAPEKLRPLRRSEYDRLVEQGVFEDEKLELLYGMLVAMTPQGNAHAFVIRKLNRLLIEALAGRAELQPQLPFAASDYSEPEPDLSVVPLGDYRTGHPSRALLVIEVAESSLRKDRNIKARLYAEAEVPEYWVVNLPESAIEVHTRPEAGAYTEVRRVGRDETLTLTQFPDIALEVCEFLP